MDRLRIAFYVASFVLSILFAVMTLREQDRINHRLDVREAYFNKGLIDGAKAREKAYYDIKLQYERVLLHCQKRATCDLPDDLKIIPAETRFESLEAILTRTREQ